MKTYLLILLVIFSAASAKAQYFSLSVDGTVDSANSDFFGTNIPTGSAFNEVLKFYPLGGSSNGVYSTLSSGTGTLGSLAFQAQTGDANIVLTLSSTSSPNLTLTSYTQNFEIVIDANYTDPSFIDAANSFPTLTQLNANNSNLSGTFTILSLGGAGTVEASGTLDSVTFQSPEPSTYALLLTGLISMAFLARRSANCRA